MIEDTIRDLKNLVVDDITCCNQDDIQRFPNPPDDCATVNVNRNNY